MPLGCFLKWTKRPSALLPAILCKQGIPKSMKRAIIDKQRSEVPFQCIYSIPNRVRNTSHMEKAVTNRLMDCVSSCTVPLSSSGVLCGAATCRVCYGLYCCAVSIAKLHKHVISDCDSSQSWSAFLPKTLIARTLFGSTVV